LHKNRKAGPTNTTSEPKNSEKMAQEGEKQRFLVKKKLLNFDKNKKSYIFAFRN
jgi:hypothetical protein